MIESAYSASVFALKNSAPLLDGQSTKQAGRRGEVVPEHPTTKENRPAMSTNEIKAAIRHMYENAPVEDDDRAETTEDVGRQVILELPAAFPRKPADDRSVKLPIRVAWNGGSGVVLEVGPYDFNDASVQMLKQAIAFFKHNGGKVVPVGPVANNSPDAAHGAEIASKKRTPEVAE